MINDTINNDVTIAGGGRTMLAGRYRIVKQFGAGGKVLGALALLAAVAAGAWWVGRTGGVSDQAERASSGPRLSIRDAGHEGVQLWEGGPYWATTNIGAEKPEDSGLYFWWGDIVGYRPSSDGEFSFNFFTNNATIFTYGKSESELKSSGWLTSGGVLSPSHDAAHVKWGGNWRMPTKQELDDLVRNCDWKWTTQNGVNGYVVRGKGTYAADSIFLPCTYCGGGTSLIYSSSYGYYWSSVPYSSEIYSSCLFFCSSGHNSNSCNYRSGGQSVRPVQGSTN